MIDKVIKGKCPQCGKGDIFESFTFTGLFRIPSMRDNCKNCGRKFSMEPGFFFGAMYVSYALVVAEMISVAIIFKFILHVNNLPTFVAMAITAVLFSKINFRLSRIIWMHLFMKKLAD